ncbi:MAG: DUF5688 family protein [Anaerovoracaceae bacterium]
MMNYKEFKAVILEQLGRELKISKPKAEIKLSKMIKNNDVTLEAINLADERSAMPTIYLNDLYEGYQNGTSIKELIEMVIGADKSFTFSSEFDLDKIMEWNYIKDKLIFKIGGEKSNQNIKNNSPTRRKNNMLISYHVTITTSDGQRGTCRITNELMDNIGVNENQLFEAASINTPRIFPVHFSAMEALRDEMIGNNGAVKAKKMDLKHQLMDIDIKEPLFVLTNDYGIEGASTICYPEVLRDIADKFGENLFILPSSIHEVILVPESRKIPIENLRKMVVSINATQVKIREKLTDDVYVFDKERGQLFSADEWAVNERRMS